MNSTSRPAPPPENPPRISAAPLHFCACLAFLLATAACLCARWGLPGLRNGHWPDALFLVLALATTLIGLARTLPVQSVLTAAALIALMASVVEIINARSGIPFGQRTYAGDFGPRCFGVLPWAIPVIWVVAILNSRGVARLILRPWRKLPKYGFWVIGLTCMLTVVFDFSLEPFASASNRFWIWWTPKSVPAWHTAPCVNFLGWFVVSFLVLAFATPWLINKRPHRSAAPDYHPLLVWLVLNLLPAAGCARDHLWSASALSAIAAIVVTVFAIRGARW